MRLQLLFLFTTPLKNMSILILSKEETEIKKLIYTTLALQKKSQSILTKTWLYYLTQKSFTNTPGLISRLQVKRLIEKNAHTQPDSVF